MGKKCKYYRESIIETYVPECTGVANDVHPQDIDGENCQHCGKKIKFKEYTSVPPHLTWEYLT